MTDAYREYLTRKRQRQAASVAVSNRETHSTQTARDYSRSLHPWFYERHPVLGGLILITVGWPVAWVIGSLADPVGVGPWMGIGTFLYGLRLIFRSPFAAGMLFVAFAAGFFFLYTRSSVCRSWSLVTRSHKVLRCSVRGDSLGATTPALRIAIFAAMLVALGCFLMSALLAIDRAKLKHQTARI